MRRTVCWFLAALAFPGLALAEDVVRPKFEKKAPTFRFDQKALVPQVSVELEALSAFRAVSQPGAQLQDHVLFHQMTRDVRRDVERMTRKAVKKYLLAAVRLDDGISIVKSRVRGERSVERRHTHYRVGFHGGLPVVGVDRDTVHGQFQLKVGADGAVGLGYSDRRMERADFRIGFDGEGRYLIRAHLAF